MQKLNTNDFSARFRAAYNKYVVAVVSSIFISVFNLCDESYCENQRVLGFAVEQFDERVLELLSLLIAIFLGLNLLLRFLDERKVFVDVEHQLKLLYNQIIEWSSNVKVEINKFTDINDKVIELERNIHSSISAVGKLDAFFKKNPNVDKSLERLESIQNQHLETIVPNTINIVSSVQSSFSILSKDIVNLHQKISKLTSNVNPTALESSTFSKKLDEIETSILSDKKFGKWANLRIWIVDIIAPIFLMLLACIAYIVPDLVYEFFLCLSKFF